MATWEIIGFEYTEGEQVSATAKYHTAGETDPDPAFTSLQTEAATTKMGLWRKSIRIREIGGGHWEGEVEYGPLSRLQIGDPPRISVSTSGGTQRITQSKATRAKYPSDAEDHKGAIGVTKDSIEGTDIVVPRFTWGETHIKAASDVGWTYRNAMHAMTGTINNAAFRGYAAGEVLFLGFDANDRGNDEVECTYKFEAAPNLSNLTIGTITGIAAYGHDHVWISYVENQGVKGNVKVPKAVYVEQVYNATNFANLGIGTTV